MDGRGPDTLRTGGELSDSEANARSRKVLEGETREGRGLAFYLEVKQRRVSVFWTVVRDTRASVHARACAASTNTRLVCALF